MADMGRSKPATDGNIHYIHQDWVGTVRMRTTSTGAVDGSYFSYPYGDGFAVSGADSDPLHYALLDHDADSGTEHAEMRQYSSTQGRWLSPDPSAGSYDFSNPQSMNRYGYVQNSPAAGIDPSGQMLDGAGAAAGCVGGPVGCVVGFAAGAFLDYEVLNKLFAHHPLILHPSPGGIDGTGGPQWNDQYGVPYPGLQGSIAQALDLPTACEFGGCGGIGNSFTNGVTAPLTWCGEHPTICTAGADLLAFARAIPAVAASALLLNMKGDAEDPNRCAEIKQNAIAECSELLGTSSYPPGVKRRKRIPWAGGSDNSGAFYACIREKMEAAGCPDY